jgi:predicted component of type VI protein secretion system
VKQNDLDEYKENAREKQKIQVYKANHKLPLKQSYRDGKHQALPCKKVKREESRGLVKMSANYLSVSINFISISPFSTWSLRK